MSISQAPSSIARRASYAFTSGALAPSGKPTTQQVATPEPCRISEQRRTHVPFTHTLAKRFFLASSHSLSTSAAVASGFKSVWSMYDAMPPMRAASGRFTPTRHAPAVTISSTRSGQISTESEPHPHWPNPPIAPSP